MLKLLEAGSLHDSSQPLVQHAAPMHISGIIAKPWRADGKIATL